MNNHRHSGVAGPLILIAIGAAFLLTNMGILSWSAWGLFRLWPLILVALGIDLLLGRRSTWGTVLAAILIAAVLGGGLWLASTGYQAPTGTGTGEVHQPLQGASQATVVLHPAAGELRLSALDAASADLISGSVSGQPSDDVRQQYNLSQGAAIFQMETTGSAVFLPSVGTGPSWSLRISPKVPLHLEVEQGAGEMSLDLRSLQLKELTVNLAVGQITVLLPARGRYTARIDGAIGDTTIILPAGLEAKITLNAALAGRSVPDGFSGQGNQYVSGGYAAAGNRVDLVIGQAIGNVSVQRASP
jgi:hypothetical protein